MNSYETVFAENLKQLRKSRGLTQKELAQAVGYSEKAVSKWECASSIPDIGCLFLIARELHTTVDALFCDQSKIYFLGIDGGGTKTALLLTDSDGDPIRRHYTDGCNPMDIGFDKATEILRNAIYEICADIPLSSVGAFAGIAGTASEAALKYMRDFFDTFGFRKVRCDTDNSNIIEAGLGDLDGITLILGTGICGFSKVGNELTRIAGWGYLIDGGGSGYNLGQEALNAYFSAADGSKSPSILTEAIKQSHPDPNVLLDDVYANGKKFIASFAPFVFDAAEKGDPNAQGIVRRNMKYAARIVETAAAKLPPREDGSPIPVVITGGLCERREIIEELQTALDRPERFTIRILDAQPVVGAVMAAKKLYLEGCAKKC